MKKKSYFCNMNRIVFSSFGTAFLLFAMALPALVSAQELQLSSVRNCDSILSIRHDDGPRFVSQDLPILYDEPDNWRSELKNDDNYPIEWQLEHGRRHTWRLGVDVATFLRDAAFSLPYTRGYTATGFFVTPYAKHLIGSDAQMTFGVHLAGVAGYKGFHSWKPLVRLEYEPFNNVRLVMGSLYGCLSHGLFEPMLDRERYIYDHYEEGVQLLADMPLTQGDKANIRLKTDTWLHWEELLEPWQPTQERFTLGSSNILQLLGTASNTQRGWSLSIPFSFLGSHRGGQFTALDTCIQSLFNENVGLRLDFALDYDNAFALDMPLFFYQDISPEKHQAYDKGWGLWPQVSYDHLISKKQHAPYRGSWRLLAQAGYWYGYQYIAPRGSYLFQSVSWHKDYFAVPEREMVTAKLALENRYKNHFALGLDAECYYDLRERGLDFAFGLYLRYKM